MLTASQKQFVKILGEVERLEGYRPYEALSAFLEMAFRAMVGATLLGEAWEKNEAEYMKTVHRFRQQKETAGACARALNCVVEGLETDEGDFIGPIFEEYAANKHTGQFFTPWALSIMSARMIMGEELKAKAEARELITISEPACGSGGMALAAVQVLKELGINPATRAHFVLQDIDQRCVQATYIQMNLIGASATVIHGNTLAVETWGSWNTLCAVMFPKRFRSESAAIAAPAPSPEQPKPVPAPAAQGALQLAFADL